MRKVIAIASAVALAFGVPALAAGQAAQAKPEQAKPDQKTETKAAPSIVGKWTVSIDPGSGPMSLPLELKLDGKKVTGSIVGPQGDSVALEGEYADNKLTFAISTPDGMQVAFTGGFKEDGTLAGTIEFGQGPFNWTATRVKDK